MTQKTSKHTSEQVCLIAGISRRQLDYWTRQQWVLPATARYPGSGNARYYSHDETQRVRLMGQLVAAGIAPGQAHTLTLRGEYDDRGIFRARLLGLVYVEVFPL